MYINYKKIGDFIGFGKKFFYDLKVKQNLAYIHKNQKQVLKKLKNKKTLNVVFYVYDASKWKAQSVYDLMDKDERFNPLIVVTKNCAIQGNANYQTTEDVKKCYEFFNRRGMKVEYGYDTEKKEFIPFDKLSIKPDIIIYTHPWYVYKTQGPVMCSKYALTYYIPYFIPASEQWHEYGLRFHAYIHKYYVPSDIIREFYSKNMSNKGANLKVVGHPVLDYYLKKEEAEKKYIIYSPHWTVCGENLRFGTFDWSGKPVLEFAKEHKELNWVFRPHPLLYRFVLTSGFMTKEDIDKYFNEWKEFAFYSEGGDYMDLFRRSYAMITDCGSFLTEYFVSENPTIHLVSEKFTGNQSVCEIDKTNYTAHNTEELKRWLNDVILNKNDYKKEDRIKLIEKFGYRNNYSAKRIIYDILEDIGEYNGQ